MGDGGSAFVLLVCLRSFAEMLSPTQLWERFHQLLAFHLPRFQSATLASDACSLQCIMRRAKKPCRLNPTIPKRVQVWFTIPHLQHPYPIHDPLRLATTVWDGMVKGLQIPEPNVRRLDEVTRLSLTGRGGD